MVLRLRLRVGEPKLTPTQKTLWSLGRNELEM